MSLERDFDPTFVSALALREKQIQQNYRPVIGVHKWFARRPGTVFRSLLLAEFNGTEPLESAFWRPHRLTGVIADPFMGGGTPVYEAVRLGFNVVGADINPMAHWIVRQSLTYVNLTLLESTASHAIRDVEAEISRFYKTECTRCSSEADVKYFLWVKQQQCPACGLANDLFPGYLVAEPVRHPRYVVACKSCGELNEYQNKPSRAKPAQCSSCSGSVHIEGPARRQKITCFGCATVFAYPSPDLRGPLDHRMWAIEYHCKSCKPRHVGRFFKRPDENDLALMSSAQSEFNKLEHTLAIPESAIPKGDETDRLHRWGYHTYRQMFGSRQLLGLGLLLARIRKVHDAVIRHALLTVFSDFLRYQNLLCRYDTYALKCQDIFSVHGFPVGLVQCENNLLGIPRVGSGAFRHFVEKFLRAKRYCAKPFETRLNGRAKTIVHIEGEKIQADLVTRFPERESEVLLAAAPATNIELPSNSLDGVFTDPPYYDNVQYAELMDFCFVWLRLALESEFDSFRQVTTRTAGELTGNVTLGRGLTHFTQGLSSVFCHYARALKNGAPFVFTYHHNDPAAYVPLVVAILDAGMTCTAVHPVAAEMGASIHIAGTQSSVLDTVFVCRRTGDRSDHADISASLLTDAEAMRKAGIKVSKGDMACLMAGHIARAAISALAGSWNPSRPLQERTSDAQRTILTISRRASAHSLPANVLMTLRAQAETNNAQTV